MLFSTLFLLLGNFCLADLPKQPENISCTFYFSKNFTCTWNSEEDDSSTVYTVNRTFSHGTDSCSNGNRTSCSFFYPKLTYPDCYTIEVEAKNGFGKQSKVTKWDLENIVKIEPPTILTVEPIRGVKYMLQVAWTKPNGVPHSDSYICQLRYRKVNSTDWRLASQKMEVHPGRSPRPYNVTGLLPLRQYAVSMQCHVSTSEFWSSWSEERMGTTEGLAPNSSLDLWRVLGPVQPNGGRTVQLLWKVTREDPNVRKTRDYNIWYFPENETTVKEAITTTSQQFKFHLGSGAYLVSVAYNTSDGVSPEATLRIPAVHEKPLQCIEAIQVYKSRDCLEVEWQTLAEEVDRWLIEWYPDSEMENLERSWEFVSQTRNWTVRAVPLDGPQVTVQNISAQTAIIKWKEIPKMKRRGFISNYTVFYKSEHGKEFARTVNSSVLKYELDSLESNTLYTVYIMANTLAGGKNGTSSKFKTLYISIIKTVILAPITGGGLLFLGILIMLCGLIKPKLKRLVCPEIPNPAKSNVVLWHGDNFKSKLHLGEVQFHDKMKAVDEKIPKPYLSSSGDLIDKLVVDFENFLDKTEVHRIELMKMQGNILNEKEENHVSSPYNSSYNFYSFSEKGFQEVSSSDLTPLKGTQEQSSERPHEDAKDRLFQRPNAIGILEPEQPPWEEAELNPYLKNSVTTREFLTSEKFSDPNKKKNEIT
ncbi:interleukin-31 receptor subunit alpha isoform X2 [Macrotis lagotis]|uniref:interleukin-31 receptor subunit alpha isoform X2 n=1 Tax=Macrotis lagotis TaxID=92651 RepID=UPI003D69B176